MSVILRYVLCNEEAAVVKETFFGYLRISDSTGKGLLDAFLEKATELQLELSDCRGQSYDNGANMKGKHSGVQARSHNLILVGKAELNASNLFDTI